MTSIGELFPKCRKLAYDARQQLALSQSSGQGVSELYMILEELNRQLDSMDDLVLRETPSARAQWKRKIAELRSESASLSNGGSGLATSQTQNYMMQRDELMLRRRRRNENEHGDLQNLAQESASLEQSNVMVLDLLQTGESVHENLREQRNRLRGVTRYLADIGNSLGLSQSTMRIIERRDITDAYLVAALCVVTLIVLYFVWLR